MVVRLIRWPRWPPLPSRKIEATIMLRRLQGLESGEAIAVELKWMGQKATALSLTSLRRSVRTNLSKDGIVGDHGVVEWNEEFTSVCNFLGNKEGMFPWEVELKVFNGSNQGPISRVVLVGTASLNLADFAPIADGKRHEFNIPLLIPAGSIEYRPLLCLSLSLLELRTAHEPSQTVQRSMVPSVAPSVEKDEPSGFIAGLKKGKIFRGYISAQKAKKACREEETDTDDSHEDDASGESEESKEASTVQRSFSYETLANAKFVGELLYLNTTISNEDEALVYFSNRKSDVRCLSPEESICKESLQQSSKRRILSWRKRNLGFRSPKAKGEPLLKKDIGEEGGDDIDFDRRQISSLDESSYGWHKSEGSTTSRSSVSEFGDDNFAIGSWEQKEVISRDGLMKLQTQVFYASIDQMSERAAGESACSALVAVIADWLLFNKYGMPIKSEFDSLIRDGSLEWRNLCENEAYKERFPDKHFDLETILQAKIRPLSVVPEKSFIGFFHPEGLEETGFDFLEGAMSFDNIWDEISRLDCQSIGVPSVYIVSWNDHFFVLRVEMDAYYIIDTLGERLFEGCNQAYILKFDKDTAIHRLPAERKASGHETTTVEDCRGKESCKEYIKSFLAAIPIRGLQADIKKGLRTSTPLHQQLQIEFHYTQFLQPLPQCSAKEATE